VDSSFGWVLFVQQVEQGPEGYEECEEALGLTVSKGCRGWGWNMGGGEVVGGVSEEKRGNGIGDWGLGM
jgi:hypothetical protein